MSVPLSSQLPGSKAPELFGSVLPLALQGWRGTPSGGWRKTLGWGGASGRSFKGQTGSKMWRRRVLVKEGTYSPTEASTWPSLVVSLARPMNGFLPMGVCSGPDSVSSL